MTEDKTKHNCSNCSAFGKHCPHKVNGDPYYYDCGMTVEELEKENAELRENYRKRGDTITSLERQLRLNIHSDKLAKATELITGLNKGLDKLYLSGLSEEQITFVEQLQDKIEQFLKE